MADHIRWQAHESKKVAKTSNWYWVVGIVAVGVAVAAIILGDWLFGIIAIIGGFAVMVAGSLPPAHVTYGVSAKGIHRGREVIPYANIARFAVDEDRGMLVIETSGLIGTTSIPLKDVDFRAIKTELKNHNVDEADEIHALNDKIAEMLGI